MTSTARRRRNLGDDSPATSSGASAVHGGGVPGWFWLLSVVGLGGLGWWWWSSQQSQSSSSTGSTGTAPTVPVVTLTSSKTKAPVLVSIQAPISVANNTVSGGIGGTITVGCGNAGGSTSVASNAQPSTYTQQALTLAEKNQTAANAEAAADGITSQQIWNTASVTPTSVTPMVAPIGPSPNTELQRDLLSFADGTQLSVCTFPSTAAAQTAYNAWMSVAESMNQAVGCFKIWPQQTIPIILVSHSAFGTANQFWLCYSYVPGTLWGLATMQGVLTGKNVPL